MLLRILTILFFALGAAVIFSLGARNPTGALISDFIGNVPFRDKILHFFVLALFSMLLNGSMDYRKINVLGRQILLGSLLIAALTTLEECSQAFIPHRNFDVKDMLCNYAGILAGSLLCSLFPMRNAKPVLWRP